MIKNNNIILSQSITKELGLYVISDQLESFEYCPKGLYHKYISEDYPDVVSESMMDGRYGETLLLGSCARGDSCEGLNKTKTGKTPIRESRLDIQANRLYGYMYARGVRINKNNVQVPLIAKYDNNIWLRGELDIFPVNVDDKISVVDVKFTKDVNNSFFSIAKKHVRTASMGCWGHFDGIAKNQPLFYHYLVRNFKNSGIEIHKRYNEAKSDIYDYIFSLDYDYSDANFHFFVAGTKSADFDSQLADFEYPFTPMRKHLLDALITESIVRIKEGLASNFKANPQEELCKSCKLKDKCLL